MTRTIEDMDNLSIAGLVLALVGGLLALVPELEALLRFTPAWQEPLLMGLLAAGAIAGAVLALRERPAIGGLVTGITAIVLAVLGPTAPGVIALLGGVLLYASAQGAGPATFEGEAPERASGPPGSSDGEQASS